MNAALNAQQAADRPCTCHPDDNPPRPCPKKYALSECRAAQQAGEPTPGDARYRFLRGDVPPHSVRWLRWRVEYWNGAYWADMRGTELDAAIDAAISAQINEPGGGK